VSAYSVTLKTMDHATGEKQPENGTSSVAHKRLALFVLCAASFMGLLDTVIVSIALPSMRRELGFSAPDAQWILNSYALTFGGLLLLMGRAADLYGRRRLFMAGLALFAISSLAGGLAWEPWVLVAARCAQGVGGAALMPASLSLVTTICAEGAERNRAVGVYGAMGSVGFVLGMVLGGVLTEFLGWRWVLLVNVPVALAVLALTPLAVPESRSEGALRALDVPGAVTATLGLAAIIYAISEAPHNGWGSTVTLGLAAVGTMLLCAFVAVERRASIPLVPLSIFRMRALSVPNAAMLLRSCAGVSLLFLLTLYFQDSLGRTPLQTGLLFVPMTLASVAAAPLAGRLVTRLGARRSAALGFAGWPVGLLLMARMPVDGFPTVVLVGMVAQTVCVTLCNVSLTIAGTSSVDEDKRSLAASVLNTSIQLGNALGLAAIAAVIAAASAALGAKAGDQAAAGALRLGMLAEVVFVALALFLILFFLRGNGSPKEPDG
jgi:EmrB/QacA subfamily drug resistance transporter